MTQKSWLAKVGPDKNRIYQLSDKTPDGRQAFFFVQVIPAKEKAFLETIERGEKITLTDYGRVLASGYGAPSEELLTRMREMHDANV